MLDIGSVTASSTLKLLTFWDKSKENYLYISKGELSLLCTKPHKHKVSTSVMNKKISKIALFDFRIHGLLRLDPLLITDSQIFSIKCFLHPQK